MLVTLRQIVGKAPVNTAKTDLRTTFCEGVLWLATTYESGLRNGQDILYYLYVRDRSEIANTNGK